MKGGQKIPLYDGHVTLRTGFDAGTGNDCRHADPSLKNRTFPLLQRAIEPAVFTIHLPPLGMPASIVGGKDNVGVFQFARIVRAHREHRPK